MSMFNVFKTTVKEAGRRLIVVKGRLINVKTRVAFPNTANFAEDRY